MKFCNYTSLDALFPSVVIEFPLLHLRGGPLDILGGGVSDPKKKFIQEIELEKKISACA